MSNEQETTKTNLFEDCVAILVDVAGTTTSINFVQETLFPFVKEQVGDFLKTNWDKDEIKNAIKLFKKSDTTETIPSLDEAVELIKTLTDKQDNNSGLKTIQGLIYKSGYENGNLKGHVFEDVQPSFESWSKIGKKIAIFSTGSVDSQKLLFSHTINGDLTEFITKYYDQTIGLKTDCESYQKIAKDLEIKPNEIVFISDNLNEVKAAKSAGFNVFLIHRDGNETIPEADRTDFTTISSFKELNSETTVKRKIEDNETTTEEEPPSKISKTETVEKPDNKTDDNKDDEIKDDKMITDEVKEQKDEKTDATKTMIEDKKTVDDDKKCDKNETEDLGNSDKDESTTAPIKETDEEKRAKIDDKIEANSTKENSQSTAKETTETNATVEDNENKETKIEEKENKNVLANGVENNGDDNMEVVEEQTDGVAEISKSNDNDNTETKETDDDKDATTTKSAEKETETTKPDEDTENTVKKLEETTKSPAAVSVEV